MLVTGFAQKWVWCTLLFDGGCSFGGNLAPVNWHAGVFKMCLFAGCYPSILIDSLHFMIKIAVVCQAPACVYTSVCAWDIVCKNECLYLAMW